MDPQPPISPSGDTKKSKPLTAHQSKKLDPSTSSKHCDGCQTLSDVLIRCQKDASKKWFLLCPGKCWMEASGGIVDGTKDRPDYRYGGVWKNKKGAVSGKKPKGKYNRPKKGEGKEGETNDADDGTDGTVEEETIDGSIESE